MSQIVDSSAHADTDASRLEALRRDITARRERCEIMAANAFTQLGYAFVGNTGEPMGNFQERIDAHSITPDAIDRWASKIKPPGYRKS